MTKPVNFKFDFDNDSTIDAITFDPRHHKLTVDGVDVSGNIMPDGSFSAGTPYRVVTFSANGQIATVATKTASTNRCIGTTDEPSSPAPNWIYKQHWTSDRP